MIFKYLTGHMYRNSPYESNNECGNCNGARCGNCEIKYYSSVTGDTELFDSEKEALGLETEYDNLLNGVKFIGDVKFLVINDHLHAEVFPMNTEDYSDIQIKCNESSSLYSKHFEKALENHNKYKECVCKNKDSELCNVYGCTDSRCYNEMKNQGRTKKKWYM